MRHFQLERADQISAGAKAEGCVGHAQHVVLVGEHETDVGGHARPQLEIGVVDIDDGIVGDDVLHGRGGVANLANRTPERLAREGVHGECGLHARAQLAHVSLGHTGVHLHFA